ncbi:extensin family protein [Roseomonas sp. SSH11]|uniref:Extensin family protein n=1 Tax=Pararoseomonas baculiformis TaxID=2820812 RepID=A0ABS4AKU4_9PROT|nr:extensin family protein [Pararoseomonas baculiformis]MBP0446814.1 extensin family protein [Pararoseomonas baculiformis]
MRRRVLLILLPVLALLLLVLPRAVMLPPAWNPLAPLDLREPPGLLTRYKLSRMAREPGLCAASFAHSGIPLQALPTQPIRDGCGIAEPVRLPTELRLSPSVPVVNCPFAAAWVIFERHGLQRAADRALGQQVTGMRHLGSYNCRNVYHREGGRRSQHATANALDIAGFTIADGRSIGLPRDWDGPPPANTFLRAVRDEACRVFGAVLGPDYNAAHRDHFHLDRGGWGVCR